MIAGDGFEFHAASDPGAHGPGAHAARDVGFESPVFGQGEGDGRNGAVAFDGEWEGVFVLEVVKSPGEVGRRNEGCFGSRDDFVSGFEAGLRGGGIGLNFGDGSALVPGKGDADGFGRRHGVAQAKWDGFA